MLVLEYGVLQLYCYQLLFVSRSCTVLITPVHTPYCLCSTISELPISIKVAQYMYRSCLQRFVLGAETSWPSCSISVHAVYSRYRYVSNKVEDRIRRAWLVASATRNSLYAGSCGQRDRHRHTVWVVLMKRWMCLLRDKTFFVCIKPSSLITSGQ